MGGGGRAGLLFVPFRATDPLHLGPCLISQQNCGALPALSQGQISLPSSPDPVGAVDLPISQSGSPSPSPPHATPLNPWDWRNTCSSLGGNP